MDREFYKNESYLWKMEIYMLSSRNKFLVGWYIYIADGLFFGSAQCIDLPVILPVAKYRYFLKSSTRTCI